MRGPTAIHTTHFYGAFFVLCPVLTSPRRKFPQFQQNDIFGLADAFRKLDVDDKGYIDEATAIKATQTSERQPYDVVRQALKDVELDSSRRVELEDYVGVRPDPTDLQAPRAIARLSYVSTSPNG